MNYNSLSWARGIGLNVYRFVFDSKCASCLSWSGGYTDTWVSRVWGALITRCPCGGSFAPAVARVVQIHFLVPRARQTTGFSSGPRPWPWPWELTCLAVGSLQQASSTPLWPVCFCPGSSTFRQRASVTRAGLGVVLCRGGGVIVGLRLLRSPLRAVRREGSNGSESGSRLACCSTRYK